MKFSILLLCVALFAVNEAKNRPNKPSKAEQIDAQLIDVKQCVACVLANALPCISECIPNPLNKQCAACILSTAPQCLGPCGFTLAHAEFAGMGTCVAQANEKLETCSITEDFCGDFTAFAQFPGCN